MKLKAPRLGSAEEIRTEIFWGARRHRNTGLGCLDAPVNPSGSVLINVDALIFLFLHHLSPLSTKFPLSFPSSSLTGLKQKKT